MTNVIDVYWKYYISLEDQFLKTQSYVEFDLKNNGHTYSMEFMKIYLAVCSEIDVVGKYLAKVLNESFPLSKRAGINEWWYAITMTDDSLLNRKCVFYNNELCPWKDFAVTLNKNKKAKRFILDPDRKPKAKSPSWWNDYNSVKHNRTGRVNEKEGLSNYSKANFKNLALAFAALYSLEVKLLETLYSKKQISKLHLELESRLFFERLHFYTYIRVLE